MYKKCKWGAVLLGALMMAVVPTADAGDPKSLVICGTPWGKYGGNDLPGKGFVPDLVMRVFRHAGYKIRTELVPWPRCVELAKRMKYDLISSAWRGPNFAPHFDPLNVILHDTVNFVALENTPIIAGRMADFYGKRVGYVRDAGGMSVFDNQNNIQIFKAAELKRLLAMLGGGRIDAIASDPVNLDETIKTLTPPFTHKLKVLQPPIQINYNSPQIAKAHPHKAQIIADFDKAYQELKAKGLYETLIRIHDLKVLYPK